MTITKNHIDLSTFLNIGKEIRTNDPFFKDDSKELERFIKSSNSYEIFTISEDNKQARAIAYIKDDSGFIGWYECSESFDTHQNLMTSIFNWFKKNNCNNINGPINGSTWSNYRFNLDSAIPKFPGEPFQPTYYVDFWRKSGFTESLKYVSEIPSRSIIRPSTRAKIEERLAEYNLRLANFPLKIDDVLKEDLLSFYLSCFKTNPFFTIVEEGCYSKLTEKLEQVIDRSLSFIIFNQENKPIAVFVGYKDLYKEFRSGEERQEDIFVIKTIATKPEYQNYQIATTMVNLIHNLAYEKGIDKIVHAMMYQKGLTATVGSNKFNAEKYSSYALFNFDLNHA